MCPSCGEPGLTAVGGRGRAGQGQGTALALSSPFMGGAET